MFVSRAVSIFRLKMVTIISARNSNMYKICTELCKATSGNFLVLLRLKTGHCEKPGCRNSAKFAEILRNLAEYYSVLQNMQEYCAIRLDYAETFKIHRKCKKYQITKFVRFDLVTLLVKNTHFISHFTSFCWWIFGTKFNEISHKSLTGTN